MTTIDSKSFRPLIRSARSALGGNLILFSGAAVLVLVAALWLTYGIDLSPGFF
jgi:hypothetical protein